MHSRPEWLERYRVQNINRNKRDKSIYVDQQSNVVTPTHYNLAGGTYCVPRNEENAFLDQYVQFIFGPRRGRLALTENAFVSLTGKSYSSVFIDLNLRYPVGSEGL